MRLTYVPLVLLALAVAFGAAWLLQQRSAAMLREQIALLQADRGDVDRLRARNAALKASRPSEDELARLRADHWALVRLRAELTTLREQIRAEENATTAKPAP